MLMTTNNKIDFLGDGTTTTFAFNIRFFEASDIEVHVLATGGVDTMLTKGTDYTVEVLDTYEHGANIIFAVAPADGTRISIMRMMPYHQTVDLPNNGKMPSESLENQLDRTTMQIQQLSDQLLRAVKVDPTSPKTPDDLMTEIKAQVESAEDSATNAANSATEANETLTAVVTAGETAVTAINTAKDTALDEIGTAKDNALADIATDKAVVETDKAIVESLTEECAIIREEIDPDALRDSVRGELFTVKSGKVYYSGSKVYKPYLLTGPGDTNTVSSTASDANPIVATMANGKTVKITTPSSIVISQGTTIRTPYSQPTLTENGTLGGATPSCAADSQWINAYNPRRWAYQAFDSSESSTWQSSGSGTHWIIFDSVSSFICTGISFKTVSNIGWSALKLQGSNDNSTWTDLWVSSVAIGASVAQNVSFEETVSYRYYRMYGTAGASAAGESGGFAYIRFSGYTESNSQDGTYGVWMDENGNISLDKTVFDYGIKPHIPNTAGNLWVDCRIYPYKFVRHNGTGWVDYNKVRLGTIVVASGAITSVASIDNFNVPQFDGWNMSAGETMAYNVLYTADQPYFVVANAGAGGNYSTLAVNNIGVTLNYVTTTGAYSSCIVNKGDTYKMVTGVSGYAYPLKRNS